MELITTEYNPFSDATERYYWDAETQQMTIRNTFDVGDILQANKAKANKTIDSRFGKQMMHHVAEIPNGVIIKLQREHNIDVFTSDKSEQNRLLRLLENPDYRYLKTTVKKLWRPT